MKGDSKQHPGRYPFFGQRLFPTTSQINIHLRRYDTPDLPIISANTAQKKWSLLSCKKAHQMPKMPISLMIAVSCWLMCCLYSCNSDYTIRQKGYYKIDFPSRQYQVFDRPGYPYSFEYPVYANVVQDTSFFDDKPENPYWININFPSFNGKIYISYKYIGRNQLDKLVDDAYKLTYKHSSKATAIRDSLMYTPNGVSGIFFKVGGNAATSRQFFVTDSTRNFLRGALYFDATPNADSLGVVNEFLETDMKHLINSLKWAK